MKKGLRNALMIGLISLGALGVGAKISGVFSKQKTTPVYEYAIEKNLGKTIAKKVESRLTSKLEENEKKFIDIISSYSKSLQEICLDSDILNNHHISEKELENVRKAGINGTVNNPEEIYAVIANGNGSENPKFYSQKNVEHSLANISSFYKFLKNNNVTDENISLLLYNPTNVKLDDMTVDDKSDADNFLNAIKNSHTDDNDVLYIAYSNPGPESNESNQNLNNNYISFDGNSINLSPKEKSDRKKIRLHSFYLASILEEKEYKKTIIIFNTWDSKNFLDLNFSPYGVDPENILGISSPNKIGPYNETFMSYLISEQIKNPKKSIKELINDESKMYYYNENGVRRSPQECPWYNKPII